jgi:hypothetical protein
VVNRIGSTDLILKGSIIVFIAVFSYISVY